MEYNVVYANRRLATDLQNGNAGDTQGFGYFADMNRLSVNSPQSHSTLTSNFRQQPVGLQPNLTHQFYARPSLLQWRAGPIPDG